MNHRWNLLLALALLAAPAVAQETPPGSETPAPAAPADDAVVEDGNQVSEEAQTMLDRIVAAQDTPRDHGLKTMKAVVELNFNNGAIKADYEVTLDESGEVSASVKPMDDPMAEQMAGQFASAVETLYASTLYGHQPHDGKRFDAVVETSGDERELVITEPNEAASGVEIRYVLNESGVVVSTVSTFEAPMMGGGQPMKQVISGKLKHESAGDAWRFTGVEIKHPMIPQILVDVSYRKLGGFDMPAEWSMDLVGMGKGTYAFKELTVNGKPVDLEKKDDDAAVATPKDDAPATDDDAGDEDEEGADDGM